MKISNKINLVPFSEFKKKALMDPEIKAEYDRLGPEYEIIEAIIRKRLEIGISQKQLAEKMGTKQSALSRLESGNYNPSLAFLKKVAAALDAKLSISMK
ncbi:MAG: helix-turn-helix transcriptional regulator [Candidatus Shapirobacteria bacterium]|nr:helix-turn-helix transcriptional regulator [Candidatus Shapirobacteria bacterium]